MPDHVHMMLAIPPKYSVAQVVGFIKGKSAIQIPRNFQGRKKHFVDQNFWARGCYVSTVGKAEDAARAYIQGQEKEDKRLEQLKLFEETATFRWPQVFNRLERFRIQATGFAGGA